MTTPSIVCYRVHSEIKVLIIKIYYSTCLNNAKPFLSQPKSNASLIVLRKRGFGRT